MNYEKDVFFFADSFNHVITMMTSSGIPIYSFFEILFLTFVQGTKSDFVGWEEKGNKDGGGQSARFNGPTGIAIDQHTGNLFVCDSDNHTIRKITPEGIFVFYL